MRLKNKQTGEIIDDGYVRETHDFQFDGQKHVLAVFKGNGHRPPERVSGGYTSLAELNEDWEDAPEESKEWWYIDRDGVVGSERRLEDSGYNAKQIGNYFLSQEEAELAVRKLKAWKRLKDKGFRFIGKTYETDKRFGSVFYKVDEDTYSEDIIKDLDLLFSDRFDEDINVINKGENND